MKNLTKSILIIMILIISIFSIILSCNMADCFKQPTVEVEGYSLKGLPDDWTDLEVDVVIYNNDWRKATVTTMSYEAEIEGVDSKKMKHTLNKTLVPNVGLKATFPLTLPTAGAAILLKKLEKGQKLDFDITGVFHVNDPVLSTFDLPINTSGKADVDVGYEKYFEQPEVTVNSFTVVKLTTVDIFYYDIDLSVDVDVTNMDIHDATIDEVKYTVNIEGFNSEKETYTTELSIENNGSAGDTINLIMPLKLKKVPITTFVTWAPTVNYTITGTFHAATNLNGSEEKFYLPLYVKGSTTIIP